jgi:hypothetical protein
MNCPCGADMTQEFNVTKISFDHTCGVDMSGHCNLCGMTHYYRFWNGEEVFREGQP